MCYRYGVPPSYTTRALSDRQAEVVLEDIGNRETVWIDMCPECKGTQYASNITSVIILLYLQDLCNTYAKTTEGTISA